MSNQAGKSGLIGRAAAAQFGGDGDPPFPRSWRKRMSWTKPRVTEVCLALEINCYASATV